MSLTTISREASKQELADEMDRRGAVIERLERDLAIANRGGLDLLYAIRAAIGWNDKTGLSLLPAECARLKKAADAAAGRPSPDKATRDALSDLVEIIDAAGLINLANGVQLGPTVWFVKASDRLAYAREALSATASA